MATADYPDNLKLSVWEKKKDSLPKGHEVGDKLKALQKKHEAVGWKAFEPAAWAKPCKKPEELEQAFAQADRAMRSATLALKKDANDLATAAGKMGKEKTAGKPMQDAAKAIGVAVNGYAGAIDDGLDDLKKAFETARLALADADDEQDEPPAALLDPKRLLAVLQQCKREPALRVQFAYVDGKEKQPPALAMHRRQGARKMYATLAAATDVKAGSFGVAWVDNTTLYLQVEKTFSGLTKKVRAPLKAAGFRVSKVVLVQEDGSLLEQDEDPAALLDPAEAAAAGGGAAAPGSDQAAASQGAAAVDDEAAFTARLKALVPRLAAAAAQKSGQDAKLLASEAGMLARKKNWGAARAKLDEAEALLSGQRAAPAAARPADARPAVSPTMVYKQSQLVWSTTRDKVRAELQRLEAEILKEYAADRALPQVTQAVRKLDRVLELFDTALVDKIDEIQSATDAERSQLHGEARDIVSRYQRFLASDPMVLALDQNPFTPIVAQAVLAKSLETLSAKLA